MKWIQFYTQISPPRQRLGSDGIALIDGRYGSSRARALAESLCRVRRCAAYQIMTGPIREAKPISPITPVHMERPQ